MSLGSALLLLLLLQIKHLAADYFLQSGYMVANKGRYGHPGGIQHAGLHAMSSAGVLLAAGIGTGTVVILALIELLLHYHIDWVKELLTRLWKLDPNVVRFWHVHGVDQALHQATYVATVWWVAAH